MDKQKRDLEYKDKIRHGGKREKLLEISNQCAMCGDTKNRIDLCTHHIFDKFDHRFQVNLCRACHAKIHVKEKKPIPESNLESIFRSSSSLKVASERTGLSRGTLRTKVKKYGLYKRNCRKCGNEFEPDERKYYYCSKECAIQAEKERIRRCNSMQDKDRKKELGRLYYQKNREKLLAKQKEYYEENKEKVLEYHRKLYLTKGGSRADEAGFPSFV